MMFYEDQHHIHLSDGQWIPDESRKSKIRYSIWWDHGELWWEAFLYLAERPVKSATLRSNASDLNAYANWLEENGIHWLNFPLKREDRCLDRFRRFLIDSSSGTSGLPSRRMNAIVNFYKWAKAKGVIEKRLKLWEDQQVAVTFFNSTGFQRTVGVWTTDLRIPHRNANVTTVEGGLLPLTSEDRDTLLAYLKINDSEQNQVLLTMFVIGFFVGARIGSIRTLRIDNLKVATIDPHDKQVMLVAAGPGTGIETKYGVSGYLRFLSPIHKFVLDFAETNISRLKRQAKASKENKSLVFLTKDGRPYSAEAINVAMKGLRDSLIRDGLTQFHDLKFHQSRATCGTELARIYMSESDISAIEQVRDWLMHKDEKTTWKYIKFLKKTKIAAKANQMFTEQFLGPNFELTGDKL
jgi:integrase